MFANRTLANGTVIPSVAFYVVAIVAIFAYGWIIRNRGLRDRLEVKIVDHHILQEIDGWGVTPFLFFSLIGWFFPGKHLQFLTVGAIWEAIECFMGQYPVKVSGKRVQVVGKTDEVGNPTE